MMLFHSDNSLSYQRPLPIMSTNAESISNKKDHSNHRFVPPPTPQPRGGRLVKSCPAISRAISRVDKDKPQPVSFREDADTSFIAHSPVYSSQKSTSYFEQCYEVEERLGSGSFGEVFRVRSKEDGKKYACKRTLLRFRGEGDRRWRLEEVQKHEQLPVHINCVRFYRAWEERQQLYLLTEVCRSSLADVVERQKKEMSEAQVWDVMIDLLQGVNHLHRHNLVHMDIKPENIFIGFDGRCKLGDFGLVIDTSQGPVTEAMEGDPKYLAPEVLHCHVGPPADMFSLGMTLLELATDLELPRNGQAWHRLRQCGDLPVAAAGLSPPLRHILSRLLHHDHTQRISADEALTLTCIQERIKWKDIRDRGRQAVKIVFAIFALVYLPFLSVYDGFMSIWKNQVWGGHKCFESPHNPLNNTLLDESGFSDEESSELAHPFVDTSASSVDSNIPPGQTVINSTPISKVSHSQFSLQRNACIFARLDDSPLQLAPSTTDPFALCNSSLDEWDSTRVSPVRSPSSHMNRSSILEENSNSVPFRNLLEMFNAAADSDSDE